MTVTPNRLDSAILTAESSLMIVESHVAVMRMHLASCDWPGAATVAQAASAAFEAHLDAIQAMYRTRART